MRAQEHLSLMIMIMFEWHFRGDFDVLRELLSFGPLTRVHIGEHNRRYRETGVGTHYMREYYITLAIPQPLHAEVLKAVRESD